jgi:ketosteroid isomerase-like protein
MCKAKRERKGAGMTTNDDVLAIVRAYHRGWTSKDFAAATRLLAPDLVVEVPINDYPTAESFAQALAGFGALVQRVALLAELADGDQAMLLYDMEVERLGHMRVAEHFTVAHGRITRIRQVHDTVAVRAAGLAREA